MKKVSTLLAMLVVFGILLAACAPGDDTNRTGTPGKPVGSNSALTPGIPVTGNGTSTPNAAMSTTKETVATSATTSANAKVAASPTTNANANVAASPTMKATASVSLTKMPSTGTNTSLLSNQMHFKVVDQQNKTIGQVKDLVLDLTARKLAYVVVTTMGDTTNVPGDMAIPWSMLSVKDSKTSASSNSSASATSTPANLTPEATLKSDNGSMDNTDGVFVFTGDAKMLSKAPAFMGSDLPDMGMMNKDWDSNLSNYWKGSSVNSNSASATATPSLTQTPAATSTTANGQTMMSVPVQGVILASKLIGYKVMDDKNKEIAKVSDVVVDVSTGMVTYAIMTVNDKLIPVPLSSLGWDAVNKVMVGVGGLTVLQGAPSYGLNSLPAMNLSDWDALPKTYWQSHTQPSLMP